MHLQHSIEGEVPTSAGGFSITRLLARAASDSCHPTASMNLCEKPTISSSSLFIALTTVGAVCLAAFFIFLWFLHRRRSRLDSLEDIKDPQEMDDYGLGPRPLSGMPKVPPQVVQTREKNSSGGRMKPFSKRFSRESLSPSLRQGAPVVPRDALMTKF